MKVALAQGSSRAFLCTYSSGASREWAAGFFELMSCRVGSIRKIGLYLKREGSRSESLKKLRFAGRRRGQMKKTEKPHNERIGGVCRPGEGANLGRAWFQRTFILKTHSFSLAVRALHSFCTTWSPPAQEDEEIARKKKANLRQEVLQIAVKHEADLACMSCVQDAGRMPAVRVHDDFAL